MMADDFVWTRRKRLEWNGEHFDQVSEIVKERTGPVENVFTLSNGDEVIVRRQVVRGTHDGCHVVWPQPWMPSRPMGAGSRTEWWPGMLVRDVKRCIEARIEYMRCL